jgi:hypothetical protein
MRHTGYAALQIAMQTGRPLNKYADPTEGERSWLTVAEAQEIVREDPSLIWIDDEATEAARVLGAKGGAAGRGASKRRDVDYSALGKRGGRPRKSCEICGSHPAYRKGVCVACHHAIEVHGATRTDAHMVECDRKRCEK